MEPITYSVILARGMYILLTLQQGLVMLHASFKTEITDWQRTLYRMTSLAMAILMLNQIFCVMAEGLIYHPSFTLIILSKTFNMLSIPAIGVVALMLTRHAQVEPVPLAIIYFPVITLLIASIAYPRPSLFNFCVAYTMILGLVLCTTSLLCYRKYMAMLKQTYSNIETKDLRWLAILIVLFFIAAVMRTIMASYDWPGATIIPLLVNMVIWYTLCDKIRDHEEATEMGEIHTNSLQSLIHHSPVSPTLPNDYEIELKINEVCQQHKHLSNPNFNSLTLAEESGLSKTEITNYFNSHDTTFFAFINMKRLEYAASQLELTTDSVLDIATRSGFCYDYTFRRAFEHKFGCTPMEYRENRRA